MAESNLNNEKNNEKEVSPIDSKIKEKVQLIIEPISKRLLVPKNSSVLNAIQILDLPVNAVCGGYGTCGKCIIRTSPNEVHLSPINNIERKYLSDEQLAQGFRLACQAKILETSRIFLTESFFGQQTQILTESLLLPEYELRPKFWKFNLKIAPHDYNRSIISDYDRLKESLMKELPTFGSFNHPIDTTFACIQKIPDVIRENNGEITVTLEYNVSDTDSPIVVLNVEPRRDDKMLYGVAFDLGTTTIVGYLLELQRGSLIATESMLNPQTTIGEDIITRIDFASQSKENMDKAQSMVLGAIDSIIGKFIKKHDIPKDDIVAVSIVGNTAMHHIFFGLPVAYLGRVPFPPVIKESITLQNYMLRLENLTEQAEIYCPPVISGYVGADTIADLIATRMDEIEPLTIMIDIGTNGELVIGNAEHGLMAASCAAGSAMEGAHIQYGMRGSNGAIETIIIDPDTLTPRIDVIGHTTPIGLCGSAIIDIAAELLKSGVLTRSGNFNKKRFEKEPHPRVRKGEHGWEYVIHSESQPAEFISPLLEGQPLVHDNMEIVITQDDIREIQKAKGAFLSAAHLLLKYFTGEPLELEQILLAGAFGNYIHKENAHFIGLLPDVSLDKVKQIGNAAGIGAQAFILNEDASSYGEELAYKVKYLEISECPEFQREYADSMLFPHRDLDRFPSLKEIYEKIPMR